MATPYQTRRATNTRSPGVGVHQAYNHPVDQGAISKAAQQAGMNLLVLFGSRVHGQIHAHSDWDFGFLPGEPADIDQLRSRLVQILATDAIDLVNLAKDSALLRMQVSAQGRLLFENQPGLFLRFQEEAARFWCDVEPVLSRAYAQILAGARARPA